MARDKLWNGLLLGAAVGYLIATSSVEWIVSVVDSIVGIFPDTWTDFTYAKEVIWTGIGLLTGLIIDKY